MSGSRIISISGLITFTSVVVWYPPPRLTHGNLSSHMSKLESAGYIEVVKEFVDKKPHTMLQLTDTGRDTFQEYRGSMMQVLGGDGC